MPSNGGSSSSSGGKIRQLVRLKQLLQRWRHRAAARSTAAPDVPAGHVAVCVGATCRRFVVRAAHLNHPVFRQLLRQAEEEFGFDRPGPLSLPCDESHFEHVLDHVSSASDPGCCHVGGRSTWQQHADSVPLLRGFVSEKPVW